MARCNVSGQDSHVAVLTPERCPFGRAIANQAATFLVTVATASQHTQPSSALGSVLFPSVGRDRVVSCSDLHRSVADDGIPLNGNLTLTT